MIINILNTILEIDKTLNSILLNKYQILIKYQNQLNLIFIHRRNLNR